MIDMVKKSSKFFKTLYTDRIIETNNENTFFSVSNVNYKEDNPYWNSLTCFPNEKEIRENTIEKAEKFFKDINKKPCIYAVSKEKIEQPDKYKKYFTDAWMFKPDNKKLGKETEVKLEKVKNEDQLKQFISLMYDTHAKELDDVYSGLSKEYGNQLKKKWKKEFDFCKTEYYIIKMNDEDIGHRIIVKDEKDAMLTTLGILPEFRGEGYGKKAFYESINKIEDRENIFLQTEAGTENEELFKHLGFETKFKGHGFVKNENN